MNDKPHARAFYTPERDGITYVDSEEEIAEGTITQLEILGGEGHEMVGALKSPLSR